MIDLHKPFLIPFNDPDISIDNLVSFTADHLGRANNNNTGGFLTQRIAATLPAFAAVNTAFQRDKGKLGVRKSSKKFKTAYRKTLAEGLAKIQVALQNIFGKKAPMMATFFPKGLTVLTRTRDDMMASELTALVMALTTQVAAVGPQLVADATALLSGWAAVYAPSESASSAKSATMTAKRTARRALQLELCRNWLTIALQFPGEPAMLDVYMQPSLLSPHYPSPDAPEAVPSPAPVP